MHREGKDINIKEVMDGWTLQMGYPVVTISKNENLENAVTISQEHFLYNTDAKIHHHQLFNRRYSSQNRTSSINMTSGDLYLPDDLWNPVMCVEEEWTSLLQTHSH